MEKEKIVIATIKRWNLETVKKFKKFYSKQYDVFVVSKKEILTFDWLTNFAPRYIFFPHWSWIIPKDIFENFECVVFHMTDLPYGRGGSPLQNLIINKVYDTKISAIRVETGLDTGDVYMKEDLHIGLGSAEENFQKISDIIFFKMIPYIVGNNPKPTKQVGSSTIFRRRRPEESDLTTLVAATLEEVYDFIRMLDAEGYPKAFFKIGNLKIEFSEVNKRTGKLVGRFEIAKKN